MIVMAEILPKVDPLLSHPAAAFVGAVLLIGAIEKLRDPSAFRESVRHYQLLPAVMVPAFAGAVPLLEVLAGASLLPVAGRQIGALLATGLLLTFTAALVINLQRGRRGIDCGCGGIASAPLGGGLVLCNLGLMLLAVLAAMPVHGRPTGWLDFVAAGFATAFLLGLYALAHTVLGNQSHLIDLKNSP